MFELNIYIRVQFLFRLLTLSASTMRPLGSMQQFDDIYFEISLREQIPKIFKYSLAKRGITYYIEWLGFFNTKLNRDPSLK